ncbi:hypothetical protein [Spongiivirga citrea]|uniref:Uncharacterized protein n=1 Tax=Spongiivirga citrea TaxID=1481457 RepID=A0A6M0CI17_9FLAO|nr:hypothetical protein [Spongiivirga citrea]NER17525.1 hypothetical protein [Spongiivirga citrea]
MKQLLLLFVTASLIVACSSVKQTEKAVATGNYDQAIETALRNLRTNKDKKRKQPYIVLLEDAFAKAASRDLERVNFLTQENNPAKLEELYNTYLRLQSRQDKIRPILPLAGASFKMENYTNNILNTKESLASYLYGNANKLMQTNDKLDYRQAYEDFEYLNKVNPGYKNTRELMKEALLRGRDYVLIKMSNESDVVIPQRLEEELMSIDTYQLNDLWSEYHNEKQKNFNYDYQMELAFRNINISPEQIKERQLVQEKLVPDGYDYELDGNGNVKKDSLGNDIKVEKFTKVTCQYYEFTQFKATQVTANVNFTDLNTKQLIESFPIASEFIFEHIYANYQGDKRALATDLLNYINARSIPFPSNEQMVYDTGEDLKAKLKSILNQKPI